MVTLSLVYLLSTVYVEPSATADMGYVRPLEVRRDSVTLGWDIPSLIDYEPIVPEDTLPARSIPRAAKLPPKKKLGKY